MPIFNVNIIHFHTMSEFFYSTFLLETHSDIMSGHPVLF